ncbi:hypothetical protein NEFER03_0159 [Nematocida sp. LUAm3]|nr:hypothetical protein NEFER03_0159 [Nematocida sp. LUAm3]KAI5173612.1 hypothetical protein NEFER02_0128 [Nematocida sp. LUAm2]KAI5176833.1 hypothetical protein NEFER01_0158 [Nematocida sp. LUAm1]
MYKSWRNKRVGKVCKREIERIEFREDEREDFLHKLSKRRVNERKRRKKEALEEKKELVREKKREYKRRERVNADIARRVMDGFAQKEESEKTIGDSIVTTREL